MASASKEVHGNRRQAKAIAMVSPSAGDRYPRQRRSPRFPFDSLVRIEAFRIGKEIPLWGRSTDLCRDGIGVILTGALRLEEVVAMQIPLPSARSVAVKASVRYCKEAHCGFAFVDLHDQQRNAIQAACERLRKKPGMDDYQPEKWKPGGTRQFRGYLTGSPEATRSLIPNAALKESPTNVLRSAMRPCPPSDS